MKKLSQLIFMSAVITIDPADKKKLPQWLKGLLLGLSKDYHYQGSVMHRYLWKNRYYFQLEIPTDHSIFCQIINEKGEFLRWPENCFQDFVKERSQESFIWRFKQTV